ncbi:MAG: V-type ATP synthase subunit I [Candidatus Nanohaloarchaea archaeon]
MITIKPAEMEKVSVTGPKKEVREVVEELHSLQLMDIDSYDGELDTGEPFDEAEDLSELLVDIKSLKSKLPDAGETGEVDFSIDEIQERLPELSEEVEQLIFRQESISREMEDLKEKRKFFRRLRGTGLDYSDLRGTENIRVAVGNIDEEVLERTDSDRYEIVEGRSASVVIYTDGLEGAVRDALRTEYEVPDVEFSGSVEDILDEISGEKRRLESEREDVRKSLDNIAGEWMGRLEAAEKFIDQKVNKAEAPLKFGTTENAFVIRGWVPADRYGEMKRELEDLTDGKIHVQREDFDEEEAPVRHENNRLVQPFESLTDLMAVPRYNELDPSFMIFLTFPLMFGFMIGDFGYGLTTFAVFYLGYRKFPGAADIFKSLMYASVATMLFGLAFGDMFGYVMFGHHSELAAITGIELFRHVPLLFHRAEHLTQVFYISAIVGVFHINVGYLLGMYNEYVNHGLKEALLAKGSWILLEIGAALWILRGMGVGAPVMAASVVTLYLGEGMEGVVEIPSLMSNILSYLRIFGVSVAAVSLAQVVNSIASPLFASGSLIGIAFGVLMLSIGHVFNTFIKIIEGFLQGIRLHYVEQFQKFYHGGGRKFVPFGSE